MTKSFVAGIVALAFIISVIAGGFAHEAIASCVPVSHGAGIAGLKAEPSAAAAIVNIRSGKLEAAKDQTTDKGQGQSNCCDNWCPSTYMLSSVNTAGMRNLLSIHSRVPSDSLSAAHRYGLERPPKLTGIL